MKNLCFNFIKSLLSGGFLVGVFDVIEGCHSHNVHDRLYNHHINQDCKYRLNIDQHLALLLNKLQQSSLEIRKALSVEFGVGFLLHVSRKIVLIFSEGILFVLTLLKIYVIIMCSIA